MGGYSDYLIGFETSLPWDREESTTTFATTATKIWGNHTLKIGGDLRMNRHLLDQVAHPRASWSFRGAQTALDTDTTAVNGFANSLASFMLDVPQFVERGLVNEQLHRGGTHKSVYTLHSRQVAGAAEHHARSRSASRGLHAVGRVHRPRADR